MQEREHCADLAHYSERIPPTHEGREINIFIMITMALHMTAPHIWSFVVAMNNSHTHVHHQQTLRVDSSPLFE